jgi:bacterioferritin-associated ferredoxin
MIVCHCKSVSDTAIRGAIANGAVDEIDVAVTCGAGTGCGSCIDEVRRICESACPVAAPVLLAVGE